MPVLTIDLQEGFAHDHVVIEIDGREVFNKKDIKTRMQIGHAARAEVELADGFHVLRVTLPAARMSRETRIDTTKITHAGVTRDGQTLTIKLAAEPFSYL